MDEQFCFSYQFERFEEITEIPVNEVIGRTVGEVFSRYIGCGGDWTRHVSSTQTHCPYELEWEI